MIIENSTLSQQISEYIASQIASGKLKPGERLLEEQLSILFGTSRAPVREALLLLEVKGVVERVARKGVFVKKYSKKEIINFYDVVYKLTQYSIEKSITNKSDEILKKVKMFLQDLEYAVSKNELKSCFLLIEKIHQSIFELSDNQTLIDLYLKVNTQWTTFRYLTLAHPESLNKSKIEYEKIFEAIENNNLETAIRMLELKKKRALQIINLILTDEGEVIV